MAGTILEFIFLLITHAAAGIYSSTLKYSKKKTYIIWGIWIVLQTGLLFITEFILTNWFLQFIVGFILSLIGQYVIFFATTKGLFRVLLFYLFTSRSIVLVAPVLYKTTIAIKVKTSSGSIYAPL